MADACGAKTRAGGRCKAPAMKNGRCRVHGGASTGAKNQNTATNALKHGIYSTALLPGEEAIESTVRGSLGAVEEELFVTRLRLRRALAAEAKSIQTNDFLVIDSSTERGGGGAAYAASETTMKRVDYTAIIDRLTARIESLEKTRIELSKANGGGDTDDMTRDDTVVLKPDEPIPEKPIV